MKLKSLLYLSWLLVSASAALAQNSLTAEEKKAGWKLLFDGKTMRGWKDPSKLSPPANAWTIEDGCLKAVGKPQYREDLVSVQTFADFELQFEWKMSVGGNSGLKYRIQEFVPLSGDDIKKAKKFEDALNGAMKTGKPPTRASAMKGGESQTYVIGFEYQTIDDDKHPDARRGALYQSGSLYSMIPRIKQAAKPIGEFNQSRLVVKGNHIEHWLNGEKVIDASLDDPAIGAGLEKRWGKSSAVYQMLTKQPKKKCPISLQHHNDAAWFRNIKIRAI